jgi:hypothetical protein
MSRYQDSANGSCICKSRLIHEAFDARVRPQELYRSADLCEIVVLLGILPMGSGVVDEPFRRHVETVETNAVICFIVWKSEVLFMGPVSTRVVKQDAVFWGQVRARQKEQNRLCLIEKDPEESVVKRSRYGGVDI